MTKNILNSRYLFLFSIILITVPIFFNVIFESYPVRVFDNFSNFADHSVSEFMNYMLNNKLYLDKDVVLQLSPLGLAHIRVYVFDPENFHFVYFIRLIFFFLIFYVYFDFLKNFFEKKTYILISYFLALILIDWGQDGIFYIPILFLILSKKNNHYLLIFLLALMSLMKFSFFLLTTFTLLFNFFLIDYKKNIKYIFFFVFSLIVFNYSTGFGVVNLINYIKINFTFLSGYTEGHAAGNKPLEVLIYLIANFTCFLLLVDLLNKSNQEFKKVFFSLIIFLGISYAAYKHSIVRHDIHVWHGLAFIMYLSSLIFLKQLNLKDTQPYLYILFLLSTITTSDVLARYPWYFNGVYDLYKNQIKSIYFRTTEYESKIKRSAILNFQERKRQFDDNKKKINDIFKIEDGKFDILSDSPLLGVLSYKNYFPRPGFLSFNTYGLENINKNRKHILNPDLKYIVLPSNFSAKLDARLFLNMDNYTWPILFNNFKFEKKLNIGNSDFIILKKNSNNDFKILKLKEKIIKTEEFLNIDICKENDYCLVKIKSEITTLGKILNFLYKPIPLQIDFQTYKDKYYSFRLTTYQSQHGFLIKPFLFTEKDIDLFYNNNYNGINIKHFKLKPHHRLILPFINLDLSELYYKQFKIEINKLKF